MFGALAIIYLIIQLPSQLIINRNMIKIAKCLSFRAIMFSNNYCFTKNSDTNKSEQVKNQNYLKSKMSITKKEEVKQTKSKQIKEINFNNNKDLKFMILSNVGLMGAIPFIPSMAVGICMLNTGVILSRLGQQVKKYLLLVNNNEVDSLGSFRPLSQYLRITITQMACLSVQSTLLTLASMDISLLFSMLWIIVSITQKLMPSTFYLALIPVFISIVISFFSQTIRTFILNKPSNIAK